MFLKAKLTKTFFIEHFKYAASTLKTSETEMIFILILKNSQSNPDIIRDVIKSYSFNMKYHV